MEMDVSNPVEHVKSFRELMELHEIKDQGLLKWPNKLPSIPKAKDRGKYYSFHNDHGHTSDRYFNLREEIENLIRRGRDKRTRVEPCTITFIEEDAKGAHYPYDDVLVVTLIVANHKVHRILVDTGSSTNTIYSSAFRHMRIGKDCLKPVTTPLTGFSSIPLPMPSGDDGLSHYDDRDGGDVGGDGRDGRDNGSHVEIIVADVSTLEMEASYDRVFAIGIFETIKLLQSSIYHVKNYKYFRNKISSWMKQDSLLFVDHFCHKTFAYHLEDDVSVFDHWLVEVKHFMKTG
ncbi:hypothetical protein FEM48_Zijuj06G0177400 [Ziziphus jujuba var. spinosa]|uniref:Uncharacterized protein n=1 Tax=Ziziphus jujuba var. spinosa TaxID=714518 RepID=A0A978VAQ1_ZIZJJ|nr:hypothetical protein FEM48_Zijuj06G0177400 [Ziziphus jujuba var. spinosa]